MLITLAQHSHQCFVPRDSRLLAARQPVIDLVAGDVTPLAPVLPIVIPAHYPHSPALPQALVTHDGTQDPFHSHMPLLWRDFPFQLIPQSFAIDADGNPITMDALWVDPDNAWWSTLEGIALFDDQGEPSRYLRDIMQRLREAQKAAEYTRELVGLLRRADALQLSEITHRHETRSVYRVSTDGLGERLDTLDAKLAGQAMVLADRIEASQAELTFEDVSG